MTIEKAQTWKTSDGRYFETLDEAKNHQFEHQLDLWALECFAAPAAAFTDADDGQPQLNMHAAQFVAALKRDRARLLTIFKELNGGSTVGGMPPPRVVESS